MPRSHRLILATAQALFAIAVTAAVLVILSSCSIFRRQDPQLMPIQCPESPRTYCPAQHGGGR